MTDYLTPVRRGVERARRVGQIGLLSAALAMGAGLLLAVPRAEARASSGTRAVATENETASGAAMQVLRSGGNAMDAAVTAALVAGVASPTSSGVGGGGFALVWSAKAAKMTSLDFRETAPRTIDQAAFERRPLPITERGKVVGVPGEVAGLADLHARFGKLPWADVVRPAARAAGDGFPVSAHLASTIAKLGGRISVDDELTALFAPGGHGRAPGLRIKNPQLAETLTRIAAGGPRAFYEGNIAADIAARVSSVGGSVTREDLAAYKPKERNPLLVKWEGYDIYTMGPPSAGGLMLAEALGSLRAEELRNLGRTSSAYQHLVAEILRGALADRIRYLGDPDYEPVSLEKLLSPDRLAKRRSSVSPDRTQSAPQMASDEHGTHHLVTADGDGNIVSLTTTVNNAFGALLASTATGIVLNDQLDDFTPFATAQSFGVARSPNMARPRARPVSSMTPTIVLKDGKPVLALGGSGGMAIAPNVVEVLLARLAFGEDPVRAVSAPRFGLPLKDSTMAVDTHASAAFRRELQVRGEVVSTEKSASHAVQLIAFEGDRKLPAADPRKGGSALVE